MTWQDYFIGKMMWELVFPLTILVVLFVGFVAWIATDEFVIRPLKKFFRKPK
jgi:hypothetical protein